MSEKAIWRIIDRNMIYRGDEFMVLVRAGDATRIVNCANALEEDKAELLETLKDVLKVARCPCPVAEAVISRLGDAAGSQGAVTSGKPFIYKSVDGDWVVDLGNGTYEDGLSEEEARRVMRIASAAINSLRSAIASKLPEWDK